MAASLAVLAGLVGCGESEKSFVPPVAEDNPFENARLGTDSTLEVMTWNLRNFAKDGAVTAAYVMDAVRGLDVDIIALQEIEDDLYFDQVRTGLEDWEGVRAGSAYKDLNLAFLYRVGGGLTDVTAPYEILVHSYALPRHPFVLEARFNGVPIVVIDNHYICCGDGYIDESNSEDRETRRRDASLLLEEYIRAHFADRGVYVVGDFNDSLTDAPDRNVFQNFLDAPDMFRFADMAIALGPGSGWSYPTWPSHLDHILITAPLFQASQGTEALTMVVPLHTYLKYGWVTYSGSISDHLPVVLRLKP